MARAIAMLERLLRGYLFAESSVAALAYAGVAALLLGEVVARELFQYSIWGSQKIAVFAAIIAGFLGLSIATAANRHLRPQFADRWWPAAWQATLERLGDSISSVIFLALGIVATMYVSDTYANTDRAAVLYWPLWPIQLVIPYAFYASGLRHAIFAWRPDLKPAPEVMEG